MTIQSVARDFPTAGSNQAQRDVAILRPYIAAEVIGVAEAAARAGRSMRAIREWCASHRIGRRIGGRWAISQVALDMFLAGDASSLEAYLAGDRTSERVCAYFDHRRISTESRNTGAASPEEGSVLAGSGLHVMRGREM